MARADIMGRGPGEDFPHHTAKFEPMAGKTPPARKDIGIIRVGVMTQMGSSGVLVKRHVCMGNCRPISVGGK